LQANALFHQLFVGTVHGNAGRPGQQRVGIVAKYSSIFPPVV